MSRFLDQIRRLRHLRETRRDEAAAAFGAAQDRVAQEEAAQQALEEMRQAGSEQIRKVAGSGPATAGLLLTMTAAVRSIGAAEAAQRSRVVIAQNDAERARDVLTAAQRKTLAAKEIISRTEQAEKAASDRAERKETDEAAARQPPGEG